MPDDIRAEIRSMYQTRMYEDERKHHTISLSKRSTSVSRNTSGRLMPECTPISCLCPSQDMYPKIHILRPWVSG